MQQVKAKKALGQHFLTDLSVAQRIADTVSEYKGSPVLEVGPGMGVLTQFLLQAGHDLTVVELDTESVDYLNAVYPDELRDRIVSADFLKLDLKQTLGDGKMVIIGNYPYNISSQIFFISSSVNSLWFHSMTFLLSSDSYLGIRCIWKWNTVWPATSPLFCTRL